MTAGYVSRWDAKQERAEEKGCQMKKEIIAEKIDQCMGNELIGWEYRPKKQESDYDEVTLHFSNGSEISIYKVHGVVHVEGD